MMDPVFTADGQTYERTAIAAWLTSHDTSPLTGVELEHMHLVPNFALKSVIAEMVSSHPDIASRLGRATRGAGGGGPSSEGDAPAGTAAALPTTALPVARRRSLLARSDSTKMIVSQCGVLNRISFVQSESKAKKLASAAAAAAASKAASAVSAGAATAQSAVSAGAATAQSAVSAGAATAQHQQASTDFKAHAIANRPKGRGQVTDFAALTIKAYVAKQQTEIRWRSFREQRCRNAIAWFFNACIYFMVTWMVLAFGVEALGPGVMAATVVAWVMGLAQVFLIVEPLQVVIVTCFPYCIEEDTRCGRCFRRVQWFYNEFLSP